MRCSMFQVFNPLAVLCWVAGGCFCLQQREHAASGGWGFFIPSLSISEVL